MPIRNEARYIKRSLGAVLAQDYPLDRLEIVVIDGMSDDGTRQLIQEMWANRPASQRGCLQLLDNPARVTPVALNLGLRQAKGQVVILIGGHCEIATNYVRHCVEILQKTGADCVGGPMTTIGEAHSAQVIALAQGSFFGVGGVAFRKGGQKPGYVDTVAFGAYRRELFDQVGRFDEELVRNQDDEFNFRLTQAGGKIWLDPSIRCAYYSRANLRGLWRQYFQYGLYKVLVIQKRRAVPSWRHLVPTTFVLSLVMTCLLALLTNQPLWLFSVAGPYAIANILACLYTTRQNWRALPLLPLAFLTLHLAYGLGFLAGIWALVYRSSFEITRRYVH
jgi:cellulose synthase/poly-beta-1,6-N-acetylglucosamine synthase-like glycosyltransferase